MMPFPQYLRYWVLIVVDVKGYLCVFFFHLFHSFLFVMSSSYCCARNGSKWQQQKDRNKVFERKSNTAKKKNVDSDLIRGRKKNVIEIFIDGMYLCHIERISCCHRRCVTEPSQVKFHSYVHKRTTAIKGIDLHFSHTVSIMKKKEKKNENLLIWMTLTCYINSMLSLFRCFLLFLVPYFLWQIGICPSAEYCVSSGICWKMW